MRKCFEPVTLGERVRERDLGWFGITEALYAPNAVLRRHVHRHSAFTVVRSGAYFLDIAGETLQCDDRAVYFERGDTAHSNRVSEAGFRSLIVEVRDGRDGDRRLPDRHMKCGEPRVMMLAAELAREFGAVDAASNLALEGLVLELMAAMLRGAADESPAAPPRWLQGVVERLRSELSRDLGLADLAADVGRHPATLARAFRRHHGCSLGAFVRRIRVQEACRALRDTDRGVADIALAVGFCDQSHLSRVFRRELGVTPRQYRAAARRS